MNGPLNGRPPHGCSRRGSSESVLLGGFDGSDNITPPSVEQSRYTIIPATATWLAYAPITDETGTRLHPFQILAWAIPAAGQPLPITVQGLCTDSILEVENASGVGRSFYFDGQPYIIPDDAAAAFWRKVAP